MIFTNEDFSISKLNKRKVCTIVLYSIEMSPMIAAIRSLPSEKNNTTIVKHTIDLSFGSAWHILMSQIVFSNLLLISCRKKP